MWLILIDIDALDSFLSALIHSIDFDFNFETVEHIMCLKLGHLFAALHNRQAMKIGFCELVGVLFLLTFLCFHFVSFGLILCVLVAI